jgi:N-acetylmuramoyl-L-alanine amidase
MFTRESRARDQPDRKPCPKKAPMPQTAQQTARATRRAPATRRTGAGPTSSRLVTIVLDPGHGGEDPGAVGRGGSYEKNVTLAVARRLRAKIEADPNMRAVMTRDRTSSCPCARAWPKRANPVRPLRFDPCRRLRQAGRAGRRCSFCPTAAPRVRPRAIWRRKRTPPT